MFHLAHCCALAIFSSGRQAHTLLLLMMLLLLLLIFVKAALARPSVHPAHEGKMQPSSAAVTVLKTLLLSPLEDKAV